MVATLTALLSEINALKARVRTLETAGARWPVVHHAQTCDQAGDAFATNVFTLSGVSALQNVVMPIILDGEMEAIRFSTVVSTDGGGSVGYAMALYRMDFRPYNPTNTWLTNPHPQLSLVQIIGSALKSTAATTTARLNLTLPSPVVLKPDDRYCVALHVNDATNGKVLQPGLSLGDYRPRPGYRTRPASTTFGTFPSVLQAYKDGPIPIVWARSIEGLARYGSGEGD